MENKTVKMRARRAYSYMPLLASGALVLLAGCTGVSKVMATNAVAQAAAAGVISPTGAQMLTTDVTSFFDGALTDSSGAANDSVSTSTSTDLSTSLSSEVDSSSTLGAADPVIGFGGSGLASVAVDPAASDPTSAVFTAQSLPSIPSTVPTFTRGSLTLYLVAPDSASNSAYIQGEHVAALLDGSTALGIQYFASNSIDVTNGTGCIFRYVKFSPTGSIVADNHQGAWRAVSSYPPSGLLPSTVTPPASFLPPDPAASGSPLVLPPGAIVRESSNSGLTVTASGSIQSSGTKVQVWSGPPEASGSALVLDQLATVATLPGASAPGYHISSHYDFVNGRPTANYDIDVSNRGTYTQLFSTTPASGSITSTWMSADGTTGNKKVKTLNTDGSATEVDTNLKTGTVLTKSIAASGTVSISAKDAQGNALWSRTQNTDGSYTTNSKNAKGYTITTTVQADKSGVTTATDASGNVVWTRMFHADKSYELTETNSAGYAIKADTNSDGSGTITAASGSVTVWTKTMSADKSYTLVWHNLTTGATVTRTYAADGSGHASAVDKDGNQLWTSTWDANKKGTITFPATTHKVTIKKPEHVPATSQFTGKNGENFQMSWKADDSGSGTISDQSGKTLATITWDATGAGKVTLAAVTKNL